jgi:hypothetical protein
MAQTTRQDLPKAFVDNRYAWGFEGYDEYPLIFPEYFRQDSTDLSYEQYTTAVGPDDLSETAEGSEIDRTVAVEGFTVYCANKKFATELPVTNEALRDNRKVENFLKAWAKGLGEAARTRQERTHAALFNQGGFTAGHSVFNNNIPNVLDTYTNPLLTYDGKPFFAASGNNHVAKYGGTFYNGVVSLDLDTTALQTVTTLLSATNAFNESGREIHLMPNIILVKSRSNNWFTAKRIVESMGEVTAVHAGVKNLFTDYVVIGNPYLSDADAWFVGQAKKGLISLTRMPLEITYYDEPRVYGKVVQGVIRYGCAVDNFRYWAGANFSQS